MANIIECPIFLGDTFIKVRPTDNTELIRSSIIELKQLKVKYDKLKAKINSEKISETSEIEKLLELEEEMQLKTSNTKLPRIDIAGMDHFWSFTEQDNVFCLVSIPNYKGDNIQMLFFSSTKAITNEFRSLRDIFTNGKFIGKKVHLRNNEEIYVVFEFKEGFIGHKLNNNIPVGPIIGYSKPEHYSDESIIELDDPELFYKYIKVLKQRGQ